MKQSICSSKFIAIPDKLAYEGPICKHMMEGVKMWDLLEEINRKAFWFKHSETVCVAMNKKHGNVCNEMKKVFESK